MFIGFAVVHGHVSGIKKLGVVSTTLELAKANWLRANHCEVDETWTPSRVNEVFDGVADIYRARVVRVNIDEIVGT